MAAVGVTMSISRLILARIKQNLNMRGIRYKQVAKELNVTESTVKRWFSSGGLSLSQLDQMCTLLELDLNQIAKIDSSFLIRETFSTLQEEFFVKNELAFILFYLLSSNVTVEKIKTILQISQQEFEQTLLQLDKNELIELHPGGKVRLLADTHTWWHPRGVLAKKYYEVIKNDFIMSDFSSSREEQWFFSGPLTVSSQEIISKKMNVLAHEIREIYRLDQRDKDAKNITLFCGMRPWIFPLLKTYLGKVKKN